MTRFVQQQRPSGALRERARRSIMRVIAGQLVVALLMIAGLTMFAGTRTGYSVMVGSLIGLLPNYYFAARLMRRRISATAIQSLREIYTGEVIKIAFTSALFVIAIMLLSIDFLTVVVSYLAMVVVHWLAVLVVDLGEVPPAAQQPGNEAHTPCK